MRNHGEATEMITITPKVEKTVIRKEFVNKGIFSSIASMSYETMSSCEMLLKIIKCYF